MAGTYYTPMLSKRQPLTTPTTICSMSEKKTGVYVPNDYVLSVAEEFPHVFLPVVSVHPYREDAIEELERCYERGSRMVKWLPNAMGIDPSNGQTLSLSIDRSKIFAYI